MDTDKLNRELQIFRNHVKIARENVIHKLVRDIKFWKTKQEKQTDHKRASKKVESFESIFSFIRSKSASELAKAVIKFKPKQEAADETRSVEQRAIMRFYENKKLQPEVKALIRRFGLKNKMDVLDKYLKGSDTEKKAKNKNKKKKSQKTGKKKVSEHDSEDQGFCEVENQPGTDDEAISDVSGHSENIAEEIAETAKPSPKLSNNKKSKRKADKNRSEIKNKVFKPPEEEDVSEGECVKIQDSFFLTSAGQSYIATVPVVDSKRLEKEELSWKRVNKRKDIFGKKENPMGKPTKSEDIHPSWKAKQQQRGMKPFQGQRKNFDENSVDSSRKQPPSDLHPSWAAKQKQKALQPFLGKKITFDSAEGKASEQTDPDLHPSWAAKQKQKGIQAFAGKKIVFDSSEPTAASPSIASIAYGKPKEAVSAQPVDLHPSWAAKQKEKGIQQFRGKKITFDD